MHPCTSPGCLSEFETAFGLAKHRSGVHGIRSERLTSQQRHERRDRASALEETAWLRKCFPGQTQDFRIGALDPGEREYVRRRLVWVICLDLAAALRRDPAEICVIIADLFVDSLRGTGLAELSLNPEHSMTEVATTRRRLHKTGRRNDDS